MDVLKPELINLTTVFRNSPLHNVTIWTLDTVCLIIMITVLSITGILGNAPILIVFMKRKDRHASNTFIKTLAVLDLLVCMFVMPFVIFYELHMVTSDGACRFFHFLSHFSVFASNLTLVAIATERYIAVCKIGLKLTITMVKRGAVIIAILSAIVAMPAIGVFAVVDKDDVTNISCQFPHEHAPEEFCHFTYTIIGIPAVTIYQLLQMGLFALILVVIIILYSCVYTVLWKRTKFRKQISARRTRIRYNVEQNGDAESEYLSSETKPVLDKSDETEAIEISGKNFQTKRNSLPSLHCGLYENITRRRTYSEPSDLPSCCQSCCEQKQRKATSVVKDVPKTKKKARRSTCRVEFVCNTADRVKSRKYYYHIRTAKMLFLCTVTYFITWVPFWLDIFGTTNSRVFRYMFFIAHATNPIIYGIVNKQVRVAGKRLCVRCIVSVCTCLRNDTAPISDGFTTGYFSNESERFVTNT